jgi:hypothetical protein
MFKFFKKKTELEVLQEKFAKLQKEAFELSKTNRTASDSKQAEAHEIEKKIAELI